MRNFLLSCLFFSSGYSLFAQSGAGPNPSLQQIVPTSPGAAALAKYVNYPVSYCNGLPQIEIPIYEIKDGDINIPISLSYHASGLKVAERPGWVGLGWTLNAEPAISRSIRGQPDEHGFIGQRQPGQDPTNQFYLIALANGGFDDYPDEFYYHLLGKSGRFYLRKDPLKVVPVPYNHISVTTDAGLNSFQINDGNGLQYSFNGNYEYPDGWMWTNCWKANKVTSLVTGSNVTFSYHNKDINDFVWNPVDYISIIDSFTYDQQGYGSGSYVDQGQYTSSGTGTPPDYGKSLPIVMYGINGTIHYYNVDIHSPSTIGTLIPNAYSTDSYTGSSNYNIFPSLVKEIDFRNGSVLFYRNANANKLDSIRVFQNGQLFKAWRFYYGYYTTEKPDIQMLRLDSLGVTDASGNIVEKYKLGYYAGDDILPSYFSKASDYWGYYNASGNRPDSSLMPPLGIITMRTCNTNSGFNYGTQVTVNFDRGANREPYENAMRTGVLNSITYPTGGRTDFVYEANRYVDPVTLAIKMGGGLRVKQIRQYDSASAGVTAIHTFKYGINEDGGGYIKLPMSNENYLTNVQDLYVGIFVNQAIGIRRRTYSCNSLTDMFFSNGSPVSYPQVTEYVGDPDYPGVGTSGKTVYTYQVPFIANTIGWKVPGTSLVAGNENSWENNLLVSKEIYKKVADGNRKIAATKYYYGGADVPGQSFDVGEVYRKRNLICGSASPGNVCFLYEAIEYLAYTRRTGDVRLFQQTDTLIYDDNSRSITTKLFAYDDSLNLVREAMVDSRGDSLVTTYKYPYSVTPVLSNHVSNNMVTPVIEKYVYRSGQQIEALKNNYFPETDNTSIDQLMPVSIYHTTGVSAPEKKIVFSKYGPYKNVSEQYKVNDYLHSYIWDYQNTYPVAEAINADSASIAYTSFEANGKGNWVFSGTVIQDASSPTGARCYNLSAGSITKSGLNTFRSFIVSYWSKNGSAAVNGSTVTGSLSRNGWTYYQHLLPAGTTSATVSGSVSIDELRLYPSDAQMNTYTYMPLTGMTTKCDLNNVITYYEYDSFGRLKVIKDQDRNILKTLDYNYKK